MRFAWAFVGIAVAIAGLVAAQPVQLGSTDGVEATAPLENHPSLGLFVLGYVNGHGPYRFLLGVSEQTALTPNLVRDTGLATESSPNLTLSTGSNQISRLVRVKSATLRVGVRDIGIDGAVVLSDRSLSAYYPVEAFGGVIGRELFRRSTVRLDLTRATISFLPRSVEPPPGSIELPLGQSGDDINFDRVSSVPVSIEGHDAQFRLGFNSGNLSFVSKSKIGRQVLAESPYRLTFLLWSPDGVTEHKTGLANRVLLGGASVGESHFTIDIAPWSSAGAFKFGPGPVDGALGLGLIGRFDLTLNTFAGKVWLSRREASSFRCPPDHAHEAVPDSVRRPMVGFSPWLYRGRGIVLSTTKGMPAERAGIRPGDEIASLDGGDVIEYYRHLDAACGASAPTRVVFKNGSGEHDVLLTPSVPPLQ